MSVTTGSVKGYLYSTILMQSFRRGLDRVRQKRDRVGRGFGFKFVFRGDARSGCGDDLEDRGGGPLCFDVSADAALAAPGSGVPKQTAAATSETEERRRPG